MTIIDVAAASDPSPDVARDLYDEALRSAWRSVGARLLVAAVVMPIVVAIAAADRNFLIAMGGSVFALLLWAGSSVRDLARLRRSTPLESFQRDRQDEIELARHRTEHAVRLASLKTWDTYRLAGSLAFVFVLEIWTGSIPAVVARAGLVKAAIVAGEWWRLVTASFLHANLGHLMANIGALLALGGLIEAYRPAPAPAARVSAVGSRGQSREPGADRQERHRRLGWHSRTGRLPARPCASTPRPRLDSQQHAPDPVGHRVCRRRQL